jgi:hypothetical protein
MRFSMHCHLSEPRLQTTPAMVGPSKRGWKGQTCVALLTTFLGIHVVSARTSLLYLLRHIMHVRCANILLWSACLAYF